MQANKVVKECIVFEEEMPDSVVESHIKAADKSRVVVLKMIEDAFKGRKIKQGAWIIVEMYCHNGD